ncbi:glycosyltransferase [Vibrio aestuarianus subsp. cardii]|uniref:CgeB family protein n=1 Tax=Vibrio aestuarianus TaxID=28171 RepID=UPI001593E52C|nr:glycosyltransferase [Vibrio aestuarianus]MDE1309874.1 glycosyltransferase [Vibrio aestuarianus]NGZ18749.1 glycosyltransferase [Vibrio aestuarianus]NGZ94416.1 glycosyltransferase [Vibrio aestuarianus subsp. cardii]
MKIVYVDYKYHYGKKELGFNSIAKDGFIASFERLGHDIAPFFYDDFVNEPDRLHMELIKFCEKEKPDLVFFLLSHDLFNKEVISNLTEKYTTVNFFGDDQWRFESFTKKLAHSFTYCVTTDPLAVKKYKSINYKNIILSQWAALDLEEFKVNHVNNYSYEVSFVGGHNFYREWFIDYLTSKGIKVHCFGVGWPAGPVSESEMSRIFRETKINLNISNSCSYDFRFLLAKPLLFFRQLRSAKVASQIKARNFEIPALNGFQLTDYVPFLEKYLNIGSEVVCYNTPNEAVDLIEYYLQSDKERENIKKLSYGKVVQDHFYINRVQDILEAIKTV